MNQFIQKVGERIRTARLASDLTQQTLAKALGMSDHQTVSAIETGLRQVQPEELAKAAEALNKPLSFFTDPYVVTEENSFSYRAKPDSQDIDTFEKRTHKLISANRRFRELLDEPPLPFGNHLRLLQKTSLPSAATACGETTAQALNLGEIPALRLRDVAEARLNIMVLYVDAPESISGAACHLSDGDFVMINRAEASFRRNFNLGHELFHIMTWEVMPPEKVDAIQSGDARPKVEKLADAFTAGLLMPFASLRERWQKRDPSGDLEAWILEAAKVFRVSGTALYWRLYNSGLAKPRDLDRVDRNNLSRSEDTDTEGKPNAYNAAFARRLHAVLDRGLVSVRKAADLLEVEPDDISCLLSSYSHEPPFAL